MSFPESDAEAKFCVKAAERLMYDQPYAGVESDLKMATRLARYMVTHWGMSEKLGPVSLLPSEGQGPLLPGVSETAPQTQWLVDEEIRQMVEEAHVEVTHLR